MDILIKGPGEVTVCLVDRAGKTMMRETLRVFGAQTVSARRPIDLELTTSNGKMPVSPVLLFRGEQQTVTFDGKEPAEFTRHRCKEIGSTDNEAEAAARGEIHHLPHDAPTRSSFASLPRP
ncbi:MAG TPA: hypothetical protein VGR45_16035 [Stellaceae bacterium]|nr:hypothetical protein [Stellaceae bacterium]